jgi:hypothetical protein
VTEYLFRNPGLLDEVLDIAIDDHTFRSDDLEFTFAARVSTVGKKSLRMTNLTVLKGLVRLRLVWGF